MSDKEKVSIIIPCYNGEKYINRCMTSVYKQSYQEIEIVFVDDGSTDSSKEKALEWVPVFEKKGYVFKYLYQENKGSGGAVNTGLKHVSGAYISLLDVDDEYLPAAVEERVKYLQLHEDVDVVRTNGWIVRAQGSFLFVNDKSEIKDDIFPLLLRGETNNWAGSYMVRAKALFDFYPEREIYTSRYGQNLQFLLPLAYRKKSGFIDKPHMNYIQLGDSLTRTEDETQIKKKSYENAEGYRNIRMTMVEKIVKDDEEKNFYLEMIEAGYWKSIMSIAGMCNDKKMMEEAFREKRQYEKPSIDDRILYYGLIAPYKCFIWRVIRKGCSFVRRKDGK